MCEITLHVRVPMDTWRQWIRHRTANVNEYSTRYSVAIDAAQHTPPGQWRRQSADNRQGSAGFLDTAQGESLTAGETTLQELARNTYEARLAAGVAREQARKDLPLSTYTEAYWKVDLHNLLHFLQLRMDDHAQEEIRAYAAIIGEEIAARWVPIVWEAFNDYRRRALRLSRIEVEVVTALASTSPERARAVAESLGLLKLDAGGQLAPNRERRELEDKLRRLGFTVPWLPPVS
jgi:thymidylate synthase (FAD)